MSQLQPSAQLSKPQKGVHSPHPSKGACTLLPREEVREDGLVGALVDGPSNAHQHIEDQDSPAPGSRLPCEAAEQRQGKKCQGTQGYHRALPQLLRGDASGTVMPWVVVAYRCIIGNAALVPLEYLSLSLVDACHWIPNAGAHVRMTCTGLSEFQKALPDSCWKKLLVHGCQKHHRLDRIHEFHLHFLDAMNLCPKSSYELVEPLLLDERIHKVDPNSSDVAVKRLKTLTQHNRLFFTEHPRNSGPINNILPNRNIFVPISLDFGCG